MAVLASASPKALWYLTRGTGVVSLLLLTIAVVLGIVTSVRWASPRWPRFILEQLHRNVSLVVLLFLAVHVATAVLDSFAPIRWLDAVIPFASAYRPIWTGLGAVAFDLLLAVALTSLLRVRLGYRTWRTVHWAAYACWPVALVHSLGTGSDTRQAWMLLIDLAAAGAVVLVVWWRARSGWPERLASRAAALVSSAVVLVGVGAWVAVGPLQSGWARAAGTPGRLIAASAQGPADGAPSPSPANIAGIPGAPFSSRFSGTADRQSAPGGAETLDLHGPLSGPPAMVLDVRLVGRALEQGLALQSGTVRLGTTTDPAAYQGNVTGLQGGRVTATVADAAGHRLALTVVVDIGNGLVHGVLNAVPAGTAADAGDPGQ